MPGQEMAKEGVKSVGGFFRAFDIAFFMPGAIVLFAIGWFHFDKLAHSTQFQQLARAWGSDSARNWLLALMVAIALIIATFVAGLFCHALVRLGCSLAERLGNKKKKHPYRSLVDQLFNHDKPPNPPAAGPGTPEYDREASELSIYLWNLSTLGWNLAVAFLLVPLIGWWRWGVGVPFWLLVAAAIALLGSDFRYHSVKLGQKKKTERRATGAAEALPHTP
ncbi:hypothetical protein F0U60_08595 [Archangium minus]|uniref:Uncharacterized protein n=1 Tax=Archangium minus TaxID=83450 RepID=A0ABY9WMV1_9BACT|nr:hypothetical protein F0U60_08595 [Archangium minus]